MKTKQILVAAVVLAALGAYLYFGEIKQKRREEAAEKAKKVIFEGIKKEDITEVVINNEYEDEIVIKKTGNDWKMEKPVKIYADNGIVGRLVRAFFINDIERRIDEPDLAAYGLENPDVKCALVDKTGGKHTAYFGDRSPTKKYVYAVFENKKDTAALVNTSIKTNCNKKIFDLRYKAVIRLDDKAVDKIKVALDEKGKNYTVALENGQWKINSPVNDFAKEQKIKAIINRLGNTNALEIEGGSSKRLRRTGLASPGQKVVFYEAGQRKTVYIGKHNRERKAYYMKGLLTDEIYLVPEAAVKNIPAPDELKNKQVLIFERGNAGKIEVNYGNKSFTAAKKESEEKRDEWKITKISGFESSEKEKIKPAALVSTIYYLEYNDVAEEAPEQAADKIYGTEKGLVEITLYDKEGEEMGALAAGNKLPAADEIYLKSTGRGKYFTVDSNFIKKLNLPGLELKE